ncbi:hypothetical protein, partial [Salmonella enterica]|uniref:hypothetical protein n=1 Tax=Salmonella enterica TaxID=28901 RepID=UPI0032969F47
QQSMFASLPTFNENFHVIDEFHLFTNVAKLIYFAVSPAHNRQFKYVPGDEGQIDDFQEYAFELVDRRNGLWIKQAMDLSKAAMPTQL